MCHMVADTLEELHDMAEKIGVERWFQNHRYPHYDICKSKRAQAIGLGAKEVNHREFVEIARRIENHKDPWLNLLRRAPFPK